MIPTIKDKYRTLAEKLYTSTLSGYVKWAYDAFAGELSATIAKKSVTLSEGSNHNGEPAIYVTISNPLTAAKDVFSDDDLLGSKPKVDEYTTYWHLMKALFDFGVRQATGADKDIDDILDDLDNDLPF